MSSKKRTPRGTEMMPMHDDVRAIVRTEKSRGLSQAEQAAFEVDSTALEATAVEIDALGETVLDGTTIDFNLPDSDDLDGTLRGEPLLDPSHLSSPSHQGQMLPPNSAYANADEVRIPPVTRPNIPKAKNSTSKRVRTLLMVTLGLAATAGAMKHFGACDSAGRTKSSPAK